jgi:hypothetical protein
MKTSELTGAALDWAVAKCEGITTAEFLALHKLPKSEFLWKYECSTDWSQGGPIIERERITIQPVVRPDGWMARTQRQDSVWEGPTPLIAAMRCYVASKLGDDINIPEELL